MTLFPRSARVLEFTELPHLGLTSRRILDARDLTNGINAVMIDCMHGVTTIGVRPSMSRACTDGITSHEPRAELAFERGASGSCASVSLNHLDGPGARPLVEALKGVSRGRSSLANWGVCRWGASRVTVGQSSLRVVGVKTSRDEVTSHVLSFSRIGGC
jgi:hypothetical protein